jgi:rhodanese-related sulfurtransferase
MQVAKYLHAQGIEAINLKGGIVDWLNNQFEVEQI